MSKTVWIIFGAICVALLGGLIYYSQSNRLDVSDVKSDGILSVDKRAGNIGDHVFGNKDSKVLLIEYGDYQCPGCGASFPTVKTVTEKYKDDIAFVYRHFPIPSLHPNARAAAASAEAAGLQGKFWEMHNLLFTKQKEWESAALNQRNDLFASYASSLGLDVNKFKTDVESDRVTQKINFDQAVARKDNVKATPSFFLNGKSLDANTYNDEAAFSKAIEDAIKQSGGTVSSTQNKQ